MALTLHGSNMERFLSTMLFLSRKIYATPLRDVKICKYPACVQISVNAKKPSKSIHHRL